MKQPMAVIPARELATVITRIISPSEVLVSGGVVAGTIVEEDVSL